MFKIRLKLSAQIKSWNIDRLHITNCDLRVLGVRVVSFCDTIRKTLISSLADATIELNALQES